MTAKPAQGYLARHDPGLNLHRFYRVEVRRGIFGDWSVTSEWGRVGSPGTVRHAWYATEDEALAAAARLYQAKLRRGYAPLMA